jgi:hypothetical protein
MAYRVVRGYTQEEAELKAGLQLAKWDERWQSLQAKQKKIASLGYGKGIAAGRSEEIQEHVTALETLLKSSLQQPPFGWDCLKDRSVFKENPPIKPTPPVMPQEPDENQLLPLITPLDRVFSGLRRKKEAIAANNLASAKEKWSEYCASIEANFQTEMLSYSKQLSA